MDNANHDRMSITDSLGLAGYVGGFTFDSGDNGDCANYPQGITSSRDAVGTANSGNYDGHQLILVSWYTTEGCGGAQSRSRITLVDWDATYPYKYRKVLLVEPTGTATTPSFTDIPIHAGGVSWYGDYLYVAETGHGLRVFDMRKILKTDTGGTADQIGHQSDGTYYAHNYAYVLPQIGTVTASTTSGIPLVWSTISLDRVSGSIVMTEYTCASACTSYPNRAPRAVRFPFAAGARPTSPSRGKPRAGPARDHDRWYAPVPAGSSAPAAVEGGDLAYGLGDGREVLLRIAPWLLATFALIWMFGLRAVTASRLVRIRSCSSPRLPKDVPEATTYRTGTVMLSSTGPSSRSRESLPSSMLLSACCSAVIRGVRPVGRSSGRNQLIRRNSFRIRCSMASSSQSYG